MFVIILNVLSPVVLFLREVNLDQNIVLTGADELKIFKSLRVYLCLVESVYCLEKDGMHCCEKILIHRGQPGGQ